MKGTLITSTLRQAVHLLAVQGILVPECHAQIVDIVRSRLGDSHVLLYAEPVFDNERNVIDWYTPVQGTPIALSKLDHETQARVRARFLAMAEDIRERVKDLRTAGDSRRGLAADILELSLRYPDENALYLVGQQPVLTCWGCGPAQAGVTPQDLTRLSSASARPSAAAPHSPDPELPSKPDEPAPAAPPRKPKAFLPWLLSLLFLLALLGLLYALFSGALPGLLSSLGLNPALPSLDLPAPDLSAEHKRADSLRKEIDELQAQLAQRREQCEQESLEVPPDASQTGDLSFMEGQWVCDSGLVDDDDNPVVVIYTFQKDGTGSITIQDKSGICSAQAHTAIDKNGVLTIITEEAIECPGALPYRGQALTCTVVGGRTRCQGKNLPDSQTWAAEFYRRR